MKKKMIPAVCGFSIMDNFNNNTQSNTQTLKNTHIDTSICPHTHTHIDPQTDREDPLSRIWVKKNKSKYLFNQHCEKKIIL